ncbi:MAG TPA: class I SAM-dependent methyltransferase [Thermomicrobiales bacterium]|nr:class I SAM-dependent methyltransferase [Thermomicrobiales bacterium]
MNGDKENSAAWYDRNTQDYIDRTQSVDLSHLHARFLAHVPDGGRLLDAGCGSGRDSLAFRAMGYNVVPMDASLAMVNHVSKLLGTDVLHLRHQDVTFIEEFDGIWSMASMLHVPHSELPNVLERYRRALVPGGVLFASFKHGEGEALIGERLFANQNATSFGQVIKGIHGLELMDAWVEQDRRPGRQDEQWFSVLCRRSA